MTELTPEQTISMIHPMPETPDETKPSVITELRSSVVDVSFDNLRAFAMNTDLLIVAAMRDVLRTPEAQGAAAEAARDCRALASDIRDAGPKPTAAGESWVASARERALASVDNLQAALASCETRLEDFEKGRRGAYSRSSSVVMKKRSSSSYTRPAPSEETAPA